MQKRLLHARARGLYMANGSFMRAVLSLLPAKPATTTKPLAHFRLAGSSTPSEYLNTPQSVLHRRTETALKPAKRVSARLTPLGISVAMALAILFSGPTPVAQAITASTDLNFQARLLTSSGSIVPDGAYNIDFKIYNADSTTGTVGTCTGACLWEETRLVASSQGVSVVNGYLSVNLGSVTAFPSTINWDQQLYLTMNVTTNGTTSCTPATSCTWNGEMQNSGHSIALTSVPLAFRANQLAVAGTNEQVLQFANNTFGQATTISLPDPGAPTATVCYQNATACGFATGSTGSYIQNQVASLQTANFRIQSAANGSVGATIEGAAGQTADLFDLTNGATSTNVLTVSAAGTTIFQNSTDSATGFAIKNSGGTQVLGVDTTNLGVNVTNLQASGTISLQGADGGSILLRTDANSGTGANAMTFSGNEITDDSRSLSLQGDGRQPPDSSTGIWESTTNFVLNGGFESGTGNTGTNSSSLSQSTGVSKFGSASVLVTPSSATGGYFANDGFTIGASSKYTQVSASTAYTWSAWVYNAGAGSLPLNMRIEWYDNTGTLLSTSTQPYTLAQGSGWQRLTLSAASPGTAAGAVPTIYGNNNTNLYSWNVDGVQFEQKGFATPYVDTKGSTATRNGAGIAAPVSALGTPTQGWAAVRLRLGFSFPYPGANWPGIFDWGGVDTNSIQAYFSPSSNNVTLRRTATGGSGTNSVSTSMAGFTAGQTVTLVFAWTSNQLAVSLNGGNFVTATPGATQTPTLAVTTFGIGTRNGATSNEVDSDVLWMSAGSGPLTNTDALNLYRMGNSDPSLSGLSTMDSAVLPTFAWDGESNQYSGTNNDPTAQSGISIDDSTLYHSGAGSLALQGGVNSTTAFQVLDTSGNSFLTVDTSTPGVSIGATGSLSKSSTIHIADTNNATGTQAVTIGSNSNTANSVTIDAGNTGTVAIGNSTSTHTINIGSANGTGVTQTLNLGNGTSSTSGGIAINIGNGNPGLGTNNVIQIGSGGTTNGTVNITIGSNGAVNHTTVIQGGNGTIAGSGAAIKIQAQAAGDILIGASAATGQIVVGSSTAANNVLIANGSGASTVSIANVQTGGAVNIGTAMTTGSILVGNTGTTTVQGSTTTLKQISGANSTTLAFQAPTATVIYNLQTATAGSYNICTSVSSVACSSVYAPASGGSGYVQLQTGSLPGSAQSGFFNITGAGILGSVMAGYTSITGGVAAFNGQVGIGTSSPGYPLDISKAAASSQVPFIDLNGQTNAPKLQLSVGSDGSHNGSAINVVSYGIGAGTESLRTEIGNWGGSQTLALSSQSGGTKVVSSVDNSGSGATGTSDYGRLRLYSVTDAQGGYSTDLGAGTTVINLDANSSNKSYINVSNLGIGNTNPSQLLGVGSSSQLTVDTSGNLVTSGTINTDTLGASALTFSGASPTITNTGTGTLTVQAAATGILQLNTAGAGTVNVGTSSSTTIGIGNTSAAVTVTGSSAAGAISVQAASSGTILIGTTNSNAITLGGNVTASADISIVGSLATQHGTDYSTTGTSNNVNFGDASLIRLTGALAQTITGIANGRDGYQLTIINAGSNAATIKNNDSTDSSASNVIITGTGSDFSLSVGASISLVYDSQSSVWRMSFGGSSVGNDFTPVGTISAYGGPASTIPTGWLAADGSSLSRTSYPSLFSVLDPSAGTFTVSLASPGVVTLSGNPFITGDHVFLETTGALPTGLTNDTMYCVLNVSGNTFNLGLYTSSTYNSDGSTNNQCGSAINTSGSQSGTHTIYYSPYGVADSTHFYLPDARGRTLVGYSGSGGKQEVSNLGNQEGLTAALRNISDYHTYLAGGTSGSGLSAPSGGTDTNPPYVYANTSGDTNNLNKPAYETVNYIIKVGASVALSAANSFIQNGTSTQTANYNIQSGSSSSITAVIQGASGQSVDILNVQDSSSDNLFQVDQNGNVTLRNATNSANALQVLNASGAEILGIDTTANNGNLVTNSDFEANATGWASKGTSTAPANTTAQFYQGNHSGTTTVSAASSGLQTGSFTSSISPSTQYQLTFYARCSATITTFTYGRQDVSGTDINNTTTATCSGSGWTAFTWHFTTGATITSPNIYMTEGTTASGTIYIDAVTLIQTTTSAFNPYENGALQINGTINTPAIFMPQANSTNAFNIENSTGTTSELNVDTLNNRVNIVLPTTSSYGANLNVGGTTTSRANSTTAFQLQSSNGNLSDILNVDTSTTNNLVTNSDFEANGTSAWAVKIGSTLSRVTTQAWQGNGSLQVAGSASNNSGASYNYTMSASTQYTLSLYAKVSSGTISDFIIGRQDVSGTDVLCFGGTNQTLTTNWQRFVCTFTTGGTITSSNIFAQKTGSVAETFFIDGVQLQTGGSVTPYNPGGGIMLEGLISSPAAFQNKIDSGTAFQIQNAAGTNNLLVADTLDSVIGIGQTPIATGSTLQVSGGISATSAIGFTNTGNANQTLTINMVVTSAVNAGDVVVIDTSNPGQVTDSAAANSTQVVGIATQSNSAGVAQPIVITGVYQVNVTGTVTVGDYLVTSSTTGTAQDTTSPSGGVIGQAMSTASSGKAWALIKPQSGAGGGSGSSANGILAVQTLTSGSGTFTVPTGVTAISVELVGAGGGGGGTAQAGSLATGGGGGGGGYTRKLITSPVASYSYAVGGGGGGGASGNNAGTAGGDSTFGSLTAKGGSSGGGSTGSSSGTAGAGGVVGSGGDINTPGGPGTPGGIGPSGSQQGGSGGNSQLSGGALGPQGTSAGASATGYGGGGSGGAGWAAANAGGNGAGGVIVITEYGPTGNSSSGSGSSNYQLMESDWTDTGATLQSTLGRSQYAVISNTIYSFGGYTGSAATNAIYSAPVSNPTNWSNTGWTLPAALYDSQLAIVGSNVYLFGGNNSSGTCTNVIYSAPTSNLSSWSSNAGSTLPGNFCQASLAVVGSTIYLYAGTANNSTAAAVIYSAPVSNPLSWSNAGGTPPGTFGSSIAVIGNYVYLFGGYGGGAVKTVYRAPVSSPTSMTTYLNILPIAWYWSQLVVVGNYIYLVGGYDGGTYYNTMMKASINNPLSWSNVSNVTIPASRVVGSAAIVGNALYYFGGYNGTAYQNTIYSAPIVNPSPDLTSNPSWKVDMNTAGSGSGTSSQTSSGNYQMDYQQITSSVTSITATSEATAATIITGNSVTYDGSTRVKIEAWMPNVLSVGGTGAEEFRAVIFRDTTAIGQSTFDNYNSNNSPQQTAGSFDINVFDTPSAGAHTYTLKAFTSGGTSPSWTIVAGNGTSGNPMPAFLVVTRANPSLQGSSTGAILNQTTTQTANFNIQSASSFSVTATIQGAGSQSADILDVKDSSNNILFGVAPTGVITLGPASATPDILVLGTKNTTGDPTCTTSGSIYYNSSSNLFRACQNGTWDSIGTGDLTTLAPTPIGGTFSSLGNSGYASNTTGFFTMFTVPATITVTNLSFYAAAVTTTGSIQAGIYTASGTKLFNVGITVTAGAGAKTAAVSPSVVLSPGTYYLGFVTVGTTNVSLNQFGVAPANAGSAVNLPSAGGAVVNGSLTVTAGTLPSSITPSSIGFSANGASVSADFLIN